MLEVVVHIHGTRDGSNPGDQAYRILSQIAPIVAEVRRLDGRIEPRVDEIAGESGDPNGLAHSRDGTQRVVTNVFDSIPSRRSGHTKDTGCKDRSFPAPSPHGASTSARSRVGEVGI